MPGLLAAHEITKSYGAVTVLDRLSLRVAPRDRVGIVGPNGIGKSTLLRILAGVDEPDAGTVTRAGAVGYLPQEPDARRGETVGEYLARRTGVADAARALDALAARLEHEPDLALAYTDALDRFLALGGGDFDARAREVAADVGLSGRLGDRVDSLSGGEAARVLLSAILLARFDVFLLDEPTNNLDFAGLERLERFLDALPAGVVVVSHDRAFLDRVVTRVVEIEAETRRVQEFAGTWSDYEHARELARDRHERAYAEYAERRAHFDVLLNDRRNQARAGGAMADRRGTNALRSKVKQAKRHIEKLDEVEKPWSPWRLQLTFDAATRGSDVVARLRRAVVEQGTFRLGPIDLEIQQGDRVAIVGPNGAGKTTLIRALLGEASLEEGTRELGRGVVVGALDQRRELFASDAPLLERFRGESGLAAGEARTLLAKFGLRREDTLRPASSLSPGERSRAVLALLQARGVNTLVLDEPTNHLDLEAIEQLERALADYPGTVLLVTHDRRLLERFDATRTVSLHSGRTTG